MSAQDSRSDRDPRRGLSLMEVILAMAILGVALAVIGELLRMGFRSSAQARDGAVAQMLAQSKMAEIASGVVPPDPIAATPFEFYPGWYYSIDVQPTEQEGLLTVQVLIEQESDRPVNFGLTRWLPDPLFVEELEVAAEEAAALAEEAAAASGDTGG